MTIADHSTDQENAASPHDNGLVYGYFDPREYHRRIRQALADKKPGEMAILAVYKVNDYFFFAATSLTADRSALKKKSGFNPQHVVPAGTQPVGYISLKQTQTANIRDGKKAHAMGRRYFKEKKLVGQTEMSNVPYTKTPPPQQQYGHYSTQELLELIQQAKDRNLSPDEPFLPVYSKKKMAAESFFVPTSIITTEDIKCNPHLRNRYLLAPDEKPIGYLTLKQVEDAYRPSMTTLTTVAKRYYKNNMLCNQTETYFKQDNSFCMYSRPNTLELLANSNMQELLALLRQVEINNDPPHTPVLVVLNTFDKNVMAFTSFSTELKQRQRGKSFLFRIPNGESLTPLGYLTYQELTTAGIKTNADLVRLVNKLYKPKPTTDDIFNNTYTDVPVKKKTRKATYFSKEKVVNIPFKTMYMHFNFDQLAELAEQAKINSEPSHAPLLSKFKREDGSIFVATSFTKHRISSAEKNDFCNIPITKDVEQLDYLTLDEAEKAIHASIKESTHFQESKEDMTSLLFARLTKNIQTPQIQRPAC